MGVPCGSEEWGSPCPTRRFCLTTPLKYSTLVLTGTRETVRHRPQGRELLSFLSLRSFGSNVQSWACSRKREYQRTKDEHTARKRGCPPRRSASAQKSCWSRTRPLSEQVWRVRTTARTPSASARGSSEELSYQLLDLIR